MTDGSRIQQLIDELASSHATPEEVCAKCPELLGVVRDRWRQMRRLRVDLDAVFPPPEVPRTTVDASFPPLAASTPSQPTAMALPQIPGYEVEAVLGRGGMGIVFRARHLRLNRLVALKMLLSGAYAGPQELARFQREAKAVAGLRHESIVRVYDVGDHDGRPYFTMEYMEGGSLAQSLTGRPVGTRYAAALVATLAEAVRVAHQGGIIHRDLKPANILLQQKAIPGTQPETGIALDVVPAPLSDFDPKIADFGLARHFDGEPALTHSGLILGTPSYMAPEQARGQKQAIGPAVDVYALGAILYELLTGRPPFHGETAAATIHQVTTQEPVPPSRLNPAVPRDLDTVSLKCLHKDPGRRYASAAALADDLRRFGEGRPIQARPLSWGARFWRWCRRNPTAAALLATALVMVGLASGGGMWFVQQRAQRDGELRSDVSIAVAQAASLRKGFRFREARELLEHARQRLGPAGPDDLRRRVDQGRADLDLAEHLDAARFLGATPVEGKFDRAGAEPLYASAFAQAGLGPEGDDSAAVAARVRESAMSAEFVAALDDWAGMTRDLQRRAWLLAVARAADPDPARDRLRQPELWQDSARLIQLARELSVAELSPQLATALGRVVLTSGGDAVPLLTAAQARFPQDFWLNLELGHALPLAHRPDEALGYFRAALALRPQASVAYCGLGSVLRDMGRLDEAIDHYQQAIRLDPNYTVAHMNLASAFGIAFATRRDWAEAVEGYAQALKRGPIQDGHFWFEYAALLLLSGDRPGYARACAQMIEKCGKPGGPRAYHVARACTLAPDAVAEASLPGRLSEKELKDHARDFWSLTEEGALAYRAGRYQNSVPFFEQSLEVDPKPGRAVLNWLWLALANQRLGKTEEARRWLGNAQSWLDQYRDGISARAEENFGVHFHNWLEAHVLRREAEAVLSQE
jgi:serine/threonine-protein kinase